MGYITLSNTVESPIQNIEILGNTYQSPTVLSDIRSVGTLQSDGRYKLSILSCGKNLAKNSYLSVTGNTNWTSYRLYYDKLKSATQYTLSYSHKSNELSRNPRLCIYYTDGTFSASDIPTTTDFTTGKITSTLGKTIQYINITFSSASSTCVYEAKDIQLEQGTTATTYEPYQYSKSDILLPTLLGKIGTVADRLYYDTTEKAWCIEKNIGTVVLNGTENWILNETINPTKTLTSGFVADLLSDGVGDDTKATTICDKLQSKSWTDIYNLDAEGIGKRPVKDGGRLYIRILKSKLATQDLAGFKSWLASNNTTVKYQLATPTKIILPLSTQIQLNSFFGTTNIFSDNTEIEPTIRAKVSKSLGATVSSLGVKTDILDSRLTSVETTKDSANVSYTSDTGYVVASNTVNGQIDNLALQGKTLVNLYDYKKQQQLDVENKKVEQIVNGIRVTNKSTYYVESPYLGVLSVKPNTTYTLIWNYKDIQNSSSTTLSIGYANSNGFYLSDLKNPISNQAGITTFTTNDLSTGYNCVALRFIRQGTTTTIPVIAEYTNIMILEGDYTSCPPSYFSGIYSTGMGLDKIEVLSHKEDGNLFDYNNYSLSFLDASTTLTISNEIITIKTTKDNGVWFPFRVKKGVTYQFNSNSISNLINVRLYSSLEGLGTQIVYDLLYGTGAYAISRTWVSDRDGIVYFRVWVGANTTATISNMIINKGTVPITYQPIRYHKKQILYYDTLGKINPVTVLRGVSSTVYDSIAEVNGKHYYNVNCGKVTLNGSESWALSSVVDANNKMATYWLRPTNYKYASDLVCDKFAYIKNTTGNPNYSIGTHISSYSNNDAIMIVVDKTLFPTVDTFKTWLASNNVTVVYQLATPTTYECVNLDLDSYATETSVIVNSGAISPKMTFDIVSHIGNTIQVLKERMAILEDIIIKLAYADTTVALNVLDLQNKMKTYHPGSF